MSVVIYGDVQTDGSWLDPINPKDIYPKRFKQDYSEEEATASSQIEKLKLRRIELLKRIANLESYKEELELVEKMLKAAGVEL